MVVLIVGPLYYYYVHRCICMYQLYLYSRYILYNYWLLARVPHLHTECDGPELRVSADDTPLSLITVDHTSFSPAGDWLATVSGLAVMKLKVYYRRTVTHCYCTKSNYFC